MSERPLSTRVLLIAVIAALGSCSEPTAITTGPPARLDIVAGNMQPGVVGAELSEPITVRVADANGQAIAGQLVNFRVTQGGGSVFAGSALTNAEGIAKERWTLGTSTAENQVVEARAVDASGEALVFGTFTAIPLPGPAANVLPNDGDNQSAPGGAAVAIAPSVKVTDSYGNSVPDVEVTFTVTAGGGSVTGGEATTNSAGVAIVGSWTLGPTPGVNTLDATVAGLAGSPVTFTATVLGAAQIVSHSGSGQLATVGTAVPIPPSARVTDANGAPVAGVVVTFAIQAGMGSITGSSTTTDSDGIATVGSWTLGTTAGVNTLKAMLSSTTFTSFSATGTAGSPTEIVKSAGDNQIALTGSAVAVAPTVILSDQYGNRVAGASVSFVVTNGGGAVTNATAITDATGRANAGAWTFGSSPGTNILEARFPGVSAAVFSGTAYPQFVATDVAVAFSGTCALDTTGAVHCWGGTTAPFNSSLPAALGGGGSFASLSTGGSSTHVCALTAAGNAYCWGSNNRGQLGDGTATSRVSPSAVSGGITFTTVVTALEASCGLTASGAVYCWGNNGSGSLGDGTTTNRTEPGLVSGSLSYVALAAGSGHVCALAADSTAYCWGPRTSGANGAPPGTEPLLVPTQVSGAQRFAAIAAGASHTCGLTADGVTYCWGSLSFFGFQDTHVPVQINTAERFVALAGGTNFTCGLRADSRLFCWGDNNLGQLGIGTSSSDPHPTAVAADLTFAQFSAGPARTCGISSDGLLWCWGGGGIGDGSSLEARVPRPVLRP